MLTLGKWKTGNQALDVFISAIKYDFFSTVVEPTLRKLPLILGERHAGSRRTRKCFNLPSLLNYFDESSSFELPFLFLFLNNFLFNCFD